MTTTHRLPALIAALLAAALIGLAGCGDDDSGATETAAGGDSEPLSKKEFIAQADEICATGDAKIDKEGLRFAGTAGEKVDELVGDVIAPGLLEEIEQLRALTPPEGDEEQIQEFLDTFQEGVEALEETPTDLAGGPALDTVIEARQMAADYGFVACSAGSSTPTSDSTE